MKYCLSGRQPEKILRKADEIKIEMRDFRAIPVYMEKYENKTLILEVDNEVPADFKWEEIEAYAQKHKDFYCVVSNKNQCVECKLRNIKFYYKYAATNFYELSALKELGASYVLIAAPLIFDLDNVAKYKIPVRAIPNLAYEPYLDHSNGVLGGWIRPEDTEAYGKYIEVFEFYAPKQLEKEAALFRVYAENKTWPGNLNLLIDFLNYDYDNRLIFDEKCFAERRMNCKQKCLSGRTCRYCINQFNFVESTLKKYLENKKEN